MAAMQIIKLSWFSFRFKLLSSEQASNQEVVGADVQASSIATQMYIWIVNAGLLGTPANRSC